MRDDAKLSARKARFASQNTASVGLKSKGSRLLNEEEQRTLWESSRSNPAESQLPILRALRETLLASNTVSPFAAAVWEASIRQAITAQQYEIVLPCLKFLVTNLAPSNRQYYLELYTYSLCMVGDIQDAVRAALQCSCLGYVDAVTRRDAFTWREYVDQEHDTLKKTLMLRCYPLFKAEIEVAKRTFKTSTSWPEQAIMLLKET